MIILKERIDNDLRVRDLRDKLVEAFNGLELGKSELNDKNIDRLNSEKKFVICKNMSIVKEKWKQLKTEQDAERETFYATQRGL